MRGLLIIALGLMTGGCVTSVVKEVVTAPFKVGGAVIDAATTSQSEADRNRGREMRKEEERIAKEERRRAREAKREAERDD